MFLKNNRSWFTLVELIVVITILSILWTIAFLSLNGYSSSARDSVRITDVSLIQKWLEIYDTKAGFYPMADGNYVTVTSSGSDISYQGFVWSKLSTLLGLNNWIIDPLDGGQYTYSVDTKYRKYHIVWLTENKDSLAFVSKTYALDFSNRNILSKWNFSLSIISNTGNTINTPLNYLQNWWTKDIDSLDPNIYWMYHNCKEIKNTLHTNTSWLYQINPTWTKVINVQCDMETNGWGWTIFQKRMDGSMDFYRDWADYKNWFWNPLTEYWIWNDNLNILTNSFETTWLRIDMQTKKTDGGIKRYAEYSSFSTDTEANKYRLSVSWFSWDTYNSFWGHSWFSFTTRNQDNDTNIGNCAVSYKWAWWYWTCHSANLNWLYLNWIHNSYANGINWSGFVWLPGNTPCEWYNPWPNNSVNCSTHPSSWWGFYSLPFVEMKLR